MFSLFKKTSLFNNKGMTLVEAMVTVFIFTILMAASLQVMLSGSDIWQTNKVRTELQQELRKAIDWMKEDLRQTGSSGITNVPADGSTKTTITFYTASGVTSGSVTWSGTTTQYVLGGTSSNQLQRISGGTTKVIAQNISLLQIVRSASTPNILTITLRAQRNTLRGVTITLNYNFKIKLRD